MVVENIRYRIADGRAIGYASTSSGYAIGFDEQDRLGDACGDHPAGDLALQLTIGLGHATRPARSREGCAAFSAAWTRRARRPRATSVASASSC